MQIKISKSQWEAAGRKSGWMKEATLPTGKLKPSTQKSSTVKAPDGQELQAAKQIANKITGIKNLLKDPVARKYVIPMLQAFGQDAEALGAIRPLLVRIADLDAKEAEQLIQQELTDETPAPASTAAPAAKAPVPQTPAAVPPPVPAPKNMSSIPAPVQSD